MSRRGRRPRAALSFNGQTGGGLIGNNWQSGPLVYGLEGDITLHLIRGDMAAVPGLVASHVDTLYTGRVRARLGYDLGDFLPFVAAGVATNEFYQADLSPLVSGSVRRATGWTAGAGLDWKVALPIIGNTVLRAEYVYEAYPSTSLALAAGPVQSRLSTQFVRVAMIARIGDRPAPAPPAGTRSGRLVRRLWRRARRIRRPAGEDHGAGSRQHVVQRDGPARRRLRRSQFQLRPLGRRASKARP